MKQETVQEIPINLIKSLDNSRIRIEEQELSSLMEDIKHRGILQPIGVYQEEEIYYIRFGNRRLQACKKLGYKTISCIISDKKMDIDTFLSDNVAENIHRKDLTPIELADVCKKLLERGYTVSEIAVLLTKTKSSILRSLVVAKSAPEAFKQNISFMKQADNQNKKGRISLSVANEIVRSPLIKGNKPNWYNQTVKTKLFDVAKREELSVQEIKLIKYFLTLGYDFSTAQKGSKNYRMIYTEFPVKIKELEKYDMPATKMVQQFISGQIPINPNLLLNKKTEGQNNDNRVY